MYAKWGAALFGCNQCAPELVMPVMQNVCKVGASEAVRPVQHCELPLLARAFSVLHGHPLSALHKRNCGLKL